MKDEQLLRYARHLMLPDIDVAGQEKLLAAKVLIVGMGGLGSPVALYLAASGVGQLVLCDYDEVELSNLQRQIVHRTANLGEAKVASAAGNLTALNPDVSIRTVNSKLTQQQLQKEIAAADIVVDCTDNFDIRFAINRTCLATGTKLVSGAAIRMEGQLMVVDPQNPASPCYQCLYGEDASQPLSCADTGIAAPVVGVIGTLQALETIKLIIGLGETLVGHLLTFDAKFTEFRKLNLARNPNCPACGRQ